MSERVRIDKWLWAARFFKTRSLAAKAVDGGKVKLNGERVKPSKELKPGDAAHDPHRRAGVDRRRARAVRAARVRPRWRDSSTPRREESLQRRQQAIEARRLRVGPVREERGRPTKRDRRLIRRFTEGN